MWRSPERANLEKKPSMRLSHEPLARARHRASASRARAPTTEYAPRTACSHRGSRSELQNIQSRLQRNPTNAFLSGAKIVEEIPIDN
jgi:hypothetical protein